MKILCPAILLLLCSACALQTEQPGLKANTLVEQIQQEQLARIRETRVLRLGVAGPESEGSPDLEKLCAEQHWKVQKIPCPPERMFGYLRAGRLDAAFLPGTSDADASRATIRMICPGCFAVNPFLVQTLNGEK